MDDVTAMREALAEAAMAEAAGDVPVGAVLLSDDGILSRGHNRREALNDPTWHAEMEVIRAASLRLGRWRLTRCTLVVTLEPCAMCAYACVLSRVDRVVYGTADPRFGASGSLHNVLHHEKHNHRPEVVRGVLQEECSAQLKAFFKARR